MDGLEAMAALILLLVHQQEHRETSSDTSDKAADKQSTTSQIEQRLRQVPPEQWHLWLKQALVEGMTQLEPPGGNVVYNWANTTRMTSAAVQLAVSIFDSGDMDLSGYEHRPVHLIEAPFQAVEQDLVRSMLWPTPSLLASFMVDLVDPKPGDRVYNPGSGAGSLLLAAWNFLQPQFKRLGVRENERMNSGTFYGLEANPLSCFISLARLKMAGLSGPNLQVGNVLHPPFKMGFDVVLCDAPFGGKVSIHSKDGAANRSASLDGVFLDHVLASLAPGGRAAMTLPSAFMIRGGLEHELRKRLCSEFRLAAVLDLPAGTWPSAAVKANLVLIERASPRLTVGFVDSIVSQQFVVQGRPIDDGWEYIEARNLRAAIEQEPASDLVASHIRHIAVDEIAENKWVLDPRKYKDLDKPDFFEQLLVLPETRILNLEETATIFKGRSNWPKEDLSVGPRSAAIYRISDVTNARIRDDGLPEVTTCNDYLDYEAEKDIPSDQWLQPNDILMTVDGTVGKVAKLQNDCIKAVAGQGVAVIRCGGTLDAQFLLAMLRTEPYQEMIQRLRAGAVISHLRMGDLRKLPVPILPREYQQRLSAARVGQSAASLLALVREDATFTFWERILLDSPHAALLLQFNDAKVSAPFALQALRALVDDNLQLFRAQIKAMENHEYPAIREFCSLAKRVENLQSIVSLPDSADKALVLQVWRQEQSLHRSKTVVNLAIADGIPLHVSMRINDLDEALIKLSRHEWERLLSETTLKASVSPKFLKLGIPQEVILIVENTSAFPLIGIEIRVPQLRAEACETFLSAGKSMSVTVTVTPASSDQITWKLSWRAKRVDLVELTGELEVVLTVHAPEEASLQRRPKSLFGIGSNPYSTGISSSHTSGYFIGRDDIIAEIQSLLRTDGPSTVIILEGVRRVGKTSLLRQLMRPEVLPGWLPVYYDFQKADGAPGLYGVPTSDIFANIVQASLLVCQARGVSVVLSEAPHESLGLSPSEYDDAIREPLLRTYREATAPFGLFVSHIEKILARLDGVRLLLMLDEFDKTQAGIENGVTSPQLAENFRSLFHSHPEVSAILTGSQLMKRLRGEFFHPLFGIGRVIPINELDLQSAQKLVVEPAEKILNYSDTARDYIVDQAACQPFIIQHICSQAFSLCLRAKSGVVTLDIAKAAARRFIDQQTHFQQVWDEDIADAKSQLLVALINDLEGGRQPLSAETLREWLNAHNIRPGAELGRQLEVLCNLQAIKRTREGGLQTYHISMPLFAVWLSDRVDISECVARIIHEYDATI